MYWTKIQRDAEADTTPSPQRSLALVDEFLMYCMRVAVGLKENALAHLFSVSVSTMSRVIITWTNYLYLVLGSIPIWATREQVNAYMPRKYKEYCPNLSVILDCTEMKCENPSSLTLQDTTVPLSLVGTVNQIWANCCVMFNYQGPLSVNE